MVATRSDSQTRNTTKLHAAISSYFSGITSNLPKEQRNIAEKIMDLANAEHYNRAHVLSKRYKICPASYDRYDMFPIEKFRASIQKKINAITSAEKEFGVRRSFAPVDATLSVIKYRLGKNLHSDDIENFYQLALFKASNPSIIPTWDSKYRLRLYFIEEYFQKADFANAVVEGYGPLEIVPGKDPNDFSPTILHEGGSSGQRVTPMGQGRAPMETYRGRWGKFIQQLQKENLGLRFNSSDREQIEDYLAAHDALLDYTSSVLRPLWDAAKERAKAEVAAEIEENGFNQRFNEKLRQEKVGRISAKAKEERRRKELEAELNQEANARQVRIKINKDRALQDARAKLYNSRNLILKKVDGKWIVDDTTQSRASIEEKARKEVETEVRDEYINDKIFSFYREKVGSDPGNLFDAPSSIRAMYKKGTTPLNADKFFTSSEFKPWEEYYKQSMAFDLFFQGDVSRPFRKWPLQLTNEDIPSHLSGAIKSSAYKDEVKKLADMLGEETINKEIFRLYKKETKESDFDTAEAFAQSPKYKTWEKEWQDNFALNKYTIKTALEQLWVDQKMPGLSAETRAGLLQQSADAISQEADKHLEDEYRFGKVIPRINRRARENDPTEDTDAEEAKGRGLTFGALRRKILSLTENKSKIPVQDYDIFPTGSVDDLRSAVAAIKRRIGQIDRRIKNWQDDAANGGVGEIFGENASPRELILYRRGARAVLEERDKLQLMLRGLESADPAHILSTDLPDDSPDYRETRRREENGTSFNTRITFPSTINARTVKGRAAIKEHGQQSLKKIIGQIEKRLEAIKEGTGKKSEESIWIATLEIMKDLQKDMAQSSNSQAVYQSIDTTNNILGRLEQRRYYLEPDSVPKTQQPNKQPDIFPGIRTDQVDVETLQDEKGRPLFQRRRNGMGVAQRDDYKIIETEEKAPLIYDCTPEGVREKINGLDEKIRAERTSIEDSYRKYLEDPSHKMSKDEARRQIDALCKVKCAELEKEKQQFLRIADSPEFKGKLVYWSVPENITDTIYNPRDVMHNLTAVNPGQGAPTRRGWRAPSLMPVDLSTTRYATAVENRDRALAALEAAQQQRISTKEDRLNLKRLETIYSKAEQEVYRLKIGLGGGTGVSPLHADAINPLPSFTWTVPNRDTSSPEWIPYVMPGERETRLEAIRSRSSKIGALLSIAEQEKKSTKRIHPVTRDALHMELGASSRNLTDEDLITHARDVRGKLDSHAQDPDSDTELSDWERHALYFQHEIQQVQSKINGARERAGLPVDASYEDIIDANPAIRADIRRIKFLRRSLHEWAEQRSTIFPNKDVGELERAKSERIAKQTNESNKLLRTIALQEASRKDLRRALDDTKKGGIDSKESQDLLRQINDINAAILANRRKLRSSEEESANADKYIRGYSGSMDDLNREIQRIKDTLTDPTSSVQQEIKISGPEVLQQSKIKALQYIVTQNRSPVLEFFYDSEYLQSLAKDKYLKETTNIEKLQSRRKQIHKDAIAFTKEQAKLEGSSQKDTLDTQMRIKEIKEQIAALAAEDEETGTTIKTLETKEKNLSNEDKKEWIRFAIRDIATDKAENQDILQKLIATLDDDNLNGTDTGFLWQAEIARQFVLQRVTNARRDVRTNPTKETREALKKAEEDAAEVCQGAHEYTKLQKIKNTAVSLASSQTVGFDRTSYEKIQDAIKLKRQSIAKAVAAGEGHTPAHVLRQLIIEYHDLQEKAQRIRQRGLAVSGVVTSEDLGHIIAEDRRDMAPRGINDFTRRVELNAKGKSAVLPLDIRHKRFMENIDTLLRDGDEELKQYGKLSEPTRDKLLIIFGKPTTGVSDTRMPDAVLMGEVASLQHTERKRIKYQEEIVDPIYNKYNIDRQEIEDNTQMTRAEKTEAIDKLTKDRDLELTTAFIKSGLPPNPLIVSDFDSRKNMSGRDLFKVFTPKSFFGNIIDYIEQRNKKENLTDSASEGFRKLKRQYEAANIESQQSQKDARWQGCHDALLAILEAQDKASSPLFSLEEREEKTSLGGLCDILETHTRLPLSFFASNADQKRRFIREIFNTGRIDALQLQGLLPPSELRNIILQRSQSDIEGGTGATPRRKISRRLGGDRSEATRNVSPREFFYDMLDLATRRLNSSESGLTNPDDKDRVVQIERCADRDDWNGAFAALREISPFKLFMPEVIDAHFALPNTEDTETTSITNVADPKERRLFERYIVAYGGSDILSKIKKSYEAELQDASKAYDAAEAATQRTDVNFVENMQERKAARERIKTYTAAIKHVNSELEKTDEGYDFFPFTEFDADYTKFDDSFLKEKGISEKVSMEHFFDLHLRRLKSIITFLEKKNNSGLTPINATRQERQSKQQEQDALLEEMMELSAQKRQSSDESERQEIDKQIEKITIEADRIGNWIVSAKLHDLPHLDTIYKELREHLREAQKKETTEEQNESYDQAFLVLKTHNDLLSRNGAKPLPSFMADKPGIAPWMFQRGTYNTSRSYTKLSPEQQRALQLWNSQILSGRDVSDAIFTQEQIQDIMDAISTTKDVRKAPYLQNLSNEERDRISSIFNEPTGTESQKLDRIYARLQSLRSSKEDISGAIASETGGNPKLVKLLESAANLKRIGSRIEANRITSPLNDALKDVSLTMRKLGVISPDQRDAIIQHLKNMGKSPSKGTLDTLTDKGVLQFAEKINSADLKTRTQEASVQSEAKLEQLLRAGDAASSNQAVYTSADAAIPADMPRLVFSDLLDPAAKYKATLGELDAEITRQKKEKGALTLSLADQDQLRQKTGLIRELTRQRNMLLTTIGVLSPRKISFTAEEMAEAKKQHEEDTAKTEEATRRYAETERQYAESARQQAGRIRTQMTGAKEVPTGISPTTSHISWRSGEPIEIASTQTRPATARSKRSATVPGSDEPIIPQKQNVGRERVITVASGPRQSAARQAGSLGRESATFADNINQILEDRKKNAAWSAQNPLHNYITRFHFNTFKNIINPSEAPSMPETEGVSPVTPDEFKSVAKGIRDGVKLVAQGNHAAGHAKIRKVLDGKRPDGSIHKDWVRAVIGSGAMHPEGFGAFYARDWGQGHMSHLEDMKSAVATAGGEDDSLIRRLKPPKNFFAKTSFTTYKKSTYSELPHSSFEMSPFPFRIGWFRNR